MRDVVSKAIRNLGIVRHQKNYLLVHVCARAVSMHVLSSLQYCAPRGYRPQSHLGLLDNVVCSAERLCEGELFLLWPQRLVLAIVYPLPTAVHL